MQHLPALIRFRLHGLTPALRERLKGLPDSRLVEHDGGTMELECSDTKATLVRLVAALQDQPGDLAALEIEESNLERVFLHLTGRALRD